MRHWTMAVWMGCAALAAGNAFGLEATVKDHLGSPTLFIDGAPEPALFFLGEPNPAADSVYQSQARMATQAGVRLFSFSVAMPWPRPGEAPDFSMLDEKMRLMLAVNPRGLALIRFTVMAPRWWLDEHPSEQMAFSAPVAEDQGDPRWVSPSSDAWRADLAEPLTAFVAYCEERWGDHIASYHPCAQTTGEWFYERSWEGVYSGFDEATRTGFARWAEARYGTVEALRAAWRLPDVTFEAVRVPTAEERDASAAGMFRDPATERFVLDFYAYQQDAVAEAIEHASRIIKEASGGRKAVTVFHGYLFELSGLPKGPATGGHLALGRLLKSPYVDILTSPTSYMERGAGGISAMMLPIDSVRAAGKLYVLEDDSRTWLTNPDTPLGRITAVKNLREAVWEHRRAYGHLAPRRMGTWYMDLISEGWLNDEGIWKNIGGLLEQYQGILSEPSAFDPEVAVVVDERSLYHTSSTNALTGPLISRFRAEWYRMGAPFRIHLLSDVVEGRVSLPKATIFIGCWRVDPEEREKLHAALQGKAAIWFYGSGYLSEAGADVAGIGALTGLAMQEEREGGSAEIRIEAFPHCPAGLADATYSSPELTLTPRWRVAPVGGVTPIARYDGGGIAAATSDAPGFQSTYIGTVGCPSALLSHMLRQAGVHVYLDSGDMVAGDATLLTVTAATEGLKRLAIPEGKALIDIDSGARFGPAESVELAFGYGEVRRFRVADPEAAAAAAAPAPAFAFNEDDRYFVLQLTNVPAHDTTKHVREIKAAFGVEAAAEGRRLGFGALPPMLLLDTVEELRTKVHLGFDVAEAEDVAVYFQIDDMHFLSDAITSDPMLCEWRAFPEPGAETGPPLPYWFNWGAWMRFPGVPCFGSPGLREYISRQLRAGVLDPMRERLARLAQRDRLDLFAGIAIGWETHIPNYAPGEPHYFINPDAPPVYARPDGETVTMPAEEMARGGYAALHWRGWTEERLVEEAAARGVSRDDLFREICFDVIQDYSAMLAETAHDAGIPRSRIFTHIVPMDSVEDTTSTTVPQIRCAVNRYATPGFTLNSSTAFYNVETLRRKIKRADAAQDRFICAESYFGGQNTRDAFSGFLREMYGNGASHVVIWGFTDPHETWYAGHPRDGAVEAARAWLGGRS